MDENKLTELEGFAKAAQDAYQPGTYNGGTLFAYFAAASPDVVLELIAEVRRLREEIETAPPGAFNETVWDWIQEQHQTGKYAKKESED